MPCCSNDNCASNRSLDNPAWRRAVWIALVVNAGFFAIEIAAGAAAGSASLQADALDFLGDAANYGISLGCRPEWPLPGGPAQPLSKGRRWFSLPCGFSGASAWHAWLGTLPKSRNDGRSRPSPLYSPMAVWRSCFIASGQATRTCAPSGYARETMRSEILPVLLAAAGVFRHQTPDGRM